MPERSKRAAAGPADEFARELALVTPELEREVGIGREDLAALLLLDDLRGFGPQTFKALHEAGVRPSEVLDDPSRLPTPGKRGDALRAAVAAVGDEARDLAQSRAVRQLVRTHEHRARIVTFADSHYPADVYASNNPVPILYVRGDLDLLAATQAVACVGSREIGPPYSELHREFATHAAKRGLAIVSGFALGADSIGHHAAVDAGGATTLVMPCGLDRPFPPENKGFFEELWHYENAIIASEFPFGTGASALTLRKRNRLIVAFARGVLLSQTSATGGAMNAYRFALEQRKPIATFEGDGTKRTSGNEQIKSGEAVPAKRGASRQQQLAETRTDRVTVFPASAPEAEAWDEWLQQLSST